MNKEKKTKEENKNETIDFEFVGEGITQGYLPIILGWVAFKISNNMNWFTVTSVCLSIFIAWCVIECKKSRRFTIAYIATLIPEILFIIYVIITGAHW